MTPSQYRIDHPDTANSLSTEAPTLEISVPARPGGEFDLVLEIRPGFDQIVGRDASADVTVPDPNVSRRHARITRDAAGVWLEDLGSTNGTYVNDHRLVERYRLHDGDRVKIGNAAAVFHGVVVAPYSSDQTAVFPEVVSPPASAERRRPISGGSSGTCPRCAAAVGPGTWFCHRCGSQQRPIAVPAVVPPTANAGATRQQLVDPHGNIRYWQFRRATRVSNGGRRPLYNESLALPAFVFRAVLLAVLVAAVIAAFVVLGLGLDHFVHLRQRGGGHAVLRHSHSVIRAGSTHK